MNLKLPTIPFGIVACAFFRQPFSKQLYKQYGDCTENDEENVITYDMRMRMPESKKKKGVRY